METRRNWIVLNILLPILPLILRGMIKLSMLHFNYEIVASSELWFILALISLIISQDLRLRNVLLDNPDKLKERTDRATTLIVWSLICVFFCGCSEFFYILTVVKIKRNTMGDMH